MPKFGNVVLGYIHTQFRKKRFIVEIIGSGDRRGGGIPQETLTVERRKHGTAVGQLPKTIKAHGIQSLEYVATFTMLRSMAVLIDKTLDVLKPGDDALLTRRPARFLLGLDLDSKFFEKGIILIGELIRHGRPPPSCARGR
jgi:hypothetical protein